MRIRKITSVALLVPVLALVPTISAESKNLADYPLRLHLFGRSQTTFYRYRSAEEAKGDGRANLFEGGEAHGVDFSYDCGEKVRSSMGYETYPARWKKPGKQLVVLMPVFGKTGQYFTCDFNTDVKDFAYASGKDGLHSESVAQFKDWMVRHDYDPEHGKNLPVRPAGRTVPGQDPDTGTADGQQTTAPPPPSASTSTPTPQQ